MIEEAEPHPSALTSASPVRVQLKRTKGWRMPPNTVKVDRSTTWGNHDFIVGEDGDAEHCVEMFHHDLDKFQVFHPADYEAWIAPLRGKNLACWCRPGSPCHADVLLELANDPQTTGASSGRQPSVEEANQNTTPQGEES